MGTPNESDPRSQLSLPPGFRFYPTDEELLVNYLCNKIAGHHFSLRVIGDVDLYKFDPWDLPSKALFGEKEWYFFSPRDRKYPNGSRPNRVAGSGYWKATGTDKMIVSEGRKVGIKKALVFYVGKAPKGRKTNWIMHEYRLSQPPTKNASTSTRLDDWVLCRIYKKNSSGQIASDNSGVQTQDCSHDSSSSSSSQYGDVLESLPEINDAYFPPPRFSSLRNLQQLGTGDFDWATLSGLNLIGPELDQAQHQNGGDFGNIMSSLNDIYAPGCVGVMDEMPRGPEIQNPTASPHNYYYYSADADPFGSRYPAQPGGEMGFSLWQ